MAHEFAAMSARGNGTAAIPQPPSSKTRVTADSTARTSSGKLHVFIEESNDSCSFTSSRHSSQGSTHPQTVEVMKTFGESCPNLTVTKDSHKADYTVSFERESLKTIRRHNKFAAFNRSGDMVFSSSTRELGNAVRSFCASIQ